MAMSDNSRRRIRRTLLIVLTMIAVLVSLAVVDRLRNKDEEYAVYSAYLLNELRAANLSWAKEMPIQIVVVDTTQMNEIPEPWAHNVASNQLGFDSLHVSTRASFIVRNFYHTRIFPKFTLPKQAWVRPTAETELLPLWNSSESLRRLGYLTLSGVGFNPSRTQALFYVEHMCGGLCGGGWYVLMERVGGGWEVRDKHYTWIS